MKPLVDIWRQPPRQNFEAMHIKVGNWGSIVFNRAKTRSEALGQVLPVVMANPTKIDTKVMQWSDTPLKDCRFFVASSDPLQGGVYFPKARSNVDALMCLVNFLQSLDSVYLEQEFGITLEKNDAR